jgi:cell wall-associated NlpC family hydrolase
MATRQEIVDEARSWIGTPWQHQQAIKGLGVDCVGLIAGIARNTHAVEDFEFEANYRRHDESAKMVELFNEYMDAIDWHDALPADVLVIKKSASHWHCMIVAERNGDEFEVIEADRSIVTKHRIDNSHKRRIHSAYRLRGLTD